MSQTRGYLAVTLAAAAILMVTMGARQSMGLFVSPINTSTGLGIATHQPRAGRRAVHLGRDPADGRRGRRPLRAAAGADRAALCCSPSAPRSRRS